MKKIIFIFLTVGLLFNTSYIQAASLVVGDPADYIIITPSAWTTALNYYVSKKTNEGYSPRVFSVEDIYANYEGAVEREKIRNFLQDAFNVWGISYVLLVGDLNYIPTGSTLTEYDNYYVLLNGGDPLQDAYIGRLPAGSYAEALDISTKWADYDTLGWARSEFCLTGDEFGGAANNDFGSYNWSVKEMVGSEVFNTIQPQDIINEMNSGYGLINWMGHGLLDDWVVEGVEFAGDQGFSYTYQNAYAMTNTNRLSFVNALCSCLTGKFSSPHSIAKSFIKAPLGGAIGYVGANRTIYITEGGYFSGNFEDNVRSQYLRYGYVMPGIAFHDAISDGVGIATYNLLGDPTAKMNLLPSVPDTLQPEISNIQLSKNNILPGNTIYLLTDITDNDCVGIVTVKITKPDSNLLEKDMKRESIGQYEAVLQYSDTDQVGTYSIQISAKDISQNEKIEPAPNLTVLPDQEPPVITNVTITPQPAYNKQVIKIEVSVTDNAGFWGISKWAEITKPNGTVVTVSIGNFGYFEETEQAGTYNAVVYAKDYSGNQATSYPTSFEILLDNEPPVISDYWVAEGYAMPWDARITFVDTPGRRITLFEKVTDNIAIDTNLNTWAEITKPDSTTVTVSLTWCGCSFPEGYFGTTTETEQVGAHSIVYFAKDYSGNLSQSEPLLFTVTGSNHPPNIILPEEIVNNDKTAYVHITELLTFIISTSDPEGDPVTLRVANTDLPTGYNFNPSTGEFSWTPDFGQDGNYTITFGAKDDNEPVVEVYETVTIVVLPALPLPSAPSNLIATAVSSSNIDLIWQDNSTNEYGFKIERKTSGGTFTQIATVDQNETVYSDSGLTGGETYYYRVRAFNPTGDSDYSNEASATTLVGQVAQRPWKTNENGTLYINQYFNHTMGYRFTPLKAGQITKLGGFFNGAKTVYLWKTVSGQLLGQAQVTASNNWNYTPIIPVNLQANESYTVGVYISDSAGSYRANINPLPQIYEAIKIEKCVYVFGNNIPTTETINYMYGQVDIEFAPVMNNPPVLNPIGSRTVNEGQLLQFTISATDSDGDTLTYSATNLPSGATFSGQTFSWTPSFSQAGTYLGVHFEVSDGKEGVDSEDITITVNNVPQIPNAPSGLSASAISSSQINLSWLDNSTNETGFKIERKTGAAGTYSQIATVGANITTYSNISLAAGTTYYYRIRAYSSDGDSSYSNETNATTHEQVTTPAAPTNLTAQALSSSSIKLTWLDNSTNETGFEIERRLSTQSTYSQIATVGTNITTYTDTGLTKNKTYYYRVRAYNSAGKSAYSNTASATTPRR